jgi:hypothetical protein
MTLAEKLTRLRGLKKGEAKMSLMMLSFPKKMGRNMHTKEMRNK